MDQIELCKENARPVKGGRRDAAALAAALAAAAAPAAASAAQAQAAAAQALAARRAREAAVAAFEARVAAASAADEDPLRAWREYAAWLQDAFAAGGEGGGAPRLVDLLERCTRSVKADARLFARLRNDAEYVKIWVAYVRTLRLRAARAESGRACGKRGAAGAGRAGGRASARSERRFARTRAVATARRAGCRAPRCCGPCCCDDSPTHATCLLRLRHFARLCPAPAPTPSLPPYPAQADLLPDPAEVFKFLHANRIGEDCALLYMCVRARRPRFRLRAACALSARRQRRPRAAPLRPLARSPLITPAPPLPSPPRPCPVSAAVQGVGLGR